MAYEVTDIRNLEVPAYKLRLGTDRRIWFCSIAESTVMSVAHGSSNIHTHFSDESFCTYEFDGEWGAIGTMDGKVLVFSADNPSLRLLIACKTQSAVGPIELDRESRQIFFVCAGMIYHVSVDGTVLSKWRCRIESFCLRLSRDAMQLWSVCDGVELIQITTGESVVWGQGRVCPYVNVAVGPTGQIACFGGESDIFYRANNPLISIQGDYNGGLFDASGRLLAREVRQESPKDVSITTKVRSGLNFDVISPCDSFATAVAETAVVASHGGSLYFLTKC